MIQADTDQLRQFFGKTIILLALALGGRLSEIVALARGDNHIVFLLDGSMRSFPEKTS